MKKYHAELYMLILKLDHWQFYSIKHHKLFNKKSHNVELYTKNELKQFNKDHFIQRNGLVVHKSDITVRQSKIK